MRDIAIHFTVQEAAVLAVMMEDLVMPMLSSQGDETDDEKAATIKPYVESALKKLKKPLMRRKVI